MSVLAINKKAILDNLHNFLLKIHTKASIEDNVNRQGVHLIIYSFMVLFILGHMVTSQQELITLPTKTQQQLDKLHVHVYEITDFRMI